jgi:hypothetical protein
MDTLTDYLNTFWPDESCQATAARALENEALLCAVLVQLVDAKVWHGWCGDTPHRFDEFAIQTSQGKVDSPLTHFIQFVQQEDTDWNRLQVGVTTATTDVERVGTSLFDLDGVGIREDSVKVRTEFERRVET